MVMQELYTGHHTPRLRRNFLITDSRCNSKSNGYFICTHRALSTLAIIRILISVRIIRTRRRNYVANSSPFANRLQWRHTLTQRCLKTIDSAAEILVSLLPKLASLECPVRERLRRNIVSFDVLIAFQIPAANLRRNPQPVHRRAIGGNIPPRYLGAPNSTCKPISPPDTRGPAESRLPRVIP